MGLFRNWNSVSVDSHDRIEGANNFPFLENYGLERLIFVVFGFADSQETLVLEEFFLENWGILAL